ncbi:cation-dependent mannose-6-phosphate receptor-like [Physella acuta]|uniref:cation-dependent mannose-6-phosphate receptor-like n=1 Tax=Physella acuta TaxID=109671 RepID=UPI0027DB713C|nr:cation-dependent mannose-6-phosphate receptor-like [Physella acuta]
MKQNALTSSSHKSFHLHSFFGLVSSVNLFLFVFVMCCNQKTFAVDVNSNSLACKFTSYTDQNMLKEEIERITPLVGKTYTSQNNEREYQFIVGICQPVIEGTIVAVVQQKLDASGKVNGDINTWFHLGNLNDTHIMLGTDWLFLEYKGGDVYGSHCGNEKKHTAIMISCDENVDDNTAKMTFIEEEKAKTDSCYYLFEMKHQAVCPKYSSSSGLSVGSILVIVFFSVLAVYLIVGFAYQRLVLKSKGIEQIPNYQFWKDFGNLQADGCDFVCRTKERRHTIGGLGDDQLDVPEMRDENLLPM